MFAGTLTGESMPKLKVPMRPDRSQHRNLDLKGKDKESLLLAGTINLISTATASDGQVRFSIDFLSIFYRFSLFSTVFRLVDDRFSTDYDLFFRPGRQRGRVPGDGDLQRERPAGRAHSPPGGVSGVSVRHRAAGGGD